MTSLKSRNQPTLLIVRLARRWVAVALVSATGCASLSGLEGFEVGTGGASTVGSSSATTANVSSASTSDASNSVSSGMTSSSGGPCGRLGEACCAGACGDPTLACNAGVCGGCVDELLSSSCARRLDGEVFCWGDNSTGNFGLGSIQMAVRAPVNVPALTGASASSTAGFYVWCYLIAGGVFCAGEEDEGQLGNAGAPDELAVNLVSAVTPPAKSLFGESNVQCALTGTNEVWCWGRSGNGVLRDPDLSLTATAPIPLSVGSDNRSLAVEREYACTLKMDGSVWCWGNASLSFGAFYGDNLGVELDPVRLELPAGVPGYQHMVGGEGFICALTAEGETYCWGYDGEYATGGTVDSLPIKVNVPMMTRLEAGNSHTCAIATDDALWCWGSNQWDQLGFVDNPVTVSDQLPAPVNHPAPLPLRDLALGYATTCVLGADRSVYCWGRNFLGEVGSNSQLESLPPERTLVPCE